MNEALNKNYLDSHKILWRYYIGFRRVFYNQYYFSIYIEKIHNYIIERFNDIDMYAIRSIYPPIVTPYYLEYSQFDNNDKPYIVSNICLPSQIGFATTPKQMMFLIKEFMLNKITNEKQKHKAIEIYKQLHKKIIQEFKYNNKPNICETFYFKIY